MPLNESFEDYEEEDEKFSETNSTENLQSEIDQTVSSNNNSIFEDFNDDNYHIPYYFDTETDEIEEHQEYLEHLQILGYLQGSHEDTNDSFFSSVSSDNSDN